MAEDKTMKPEELQEEQLDEVSGGHIAGGDDSNQLWGPIQSRILQTMAVITISELINTCIKNPSGRVWW